MAKTEQMTLLNQRIEQKIRQQVSGKRGKNDVPYRDLTAEEQSKILPQIVSRCVTQVIEFCSETDSSTRQRLCRESLQALSEALSETSAEVDMKETKEQHQVMLSMVSQLI